MGKVILFGVLSLFVANASLAQWSADPGVNNLIHTNTTYDSYQTRVVSDGAGGAIVGCIESSPAKIFVQRIDSAGFIRWTSNGVLVSGTDTVGSELTIVADGVGGAFVVWLQQTATGGGYYKIKAQRINAVGALQWPAGGVRVCTTDSANQQSAVAVADGAGGVIVAWGEHRTYADDWARAQHIDAAGVVQWAPDGLTLTQSPYLGYKQQLTIASDGANGAIIAWEDSRAPIGYSLMNIFAERFSSSGVRLWAADGVPVSYQTTLNAYGKINPYIVSDGAGGGIVVWEDRYTANSFPGPYYIDIHAQRIDGSGASQWPEVAVCSADSDQMNPKVVSDGAGGAVIAWLDFRENKSLDHVYAQRVNSSGTVQWAANGVSMYQIAEGVQGQFDVAGDGTGGAIVSYSRVVSSLQDTVGAQRIDGSGTVMWPTNGVYVCKAPGVKQYPVIVSSSDNGAIVAWNDSRNRGGATGYEIYAQRINQSGSLTAVKEVAGGVPEQFVLAQNYPNPFNPSTTIEYELPHLSQVSLKVYNTLGQEVATLLNETKPAGVYSVEFDAGNLSTGVYFYRLTAGPSTECRKMVLMK